MQGSGSGLVSLVLAALGAGQVVDVVEEAVGMPYDDALTGGEVAEATALARDEHGPFTPCGSDQQGVAGVAATELTGAVLSQGRHPRRVRPRGLLVVARGAQPGEQIGITERAVLGRDTPSTTPNVGTSMAGMLSTGTPSPGPGCC
jgi:hypothetical protein